MILYKGRNEKIRDNSWLFIFILLALILNGCEKKNSFPGTFPRIKTYPVSNITDKGATFNGDIYSLGSEPITDHGFVWGTLPQPTILDNKIFLGPFPDGGPYSADIVSALTKNAEYTVRSFVQTADHIVYGIPVTFKSLGSGGPLIKSFSPDSAAWGDTILIKGTNFSWDAKENIVKLNQLKCETLSSTDSSIYIIVNNKLSEPAAVLSVELSGVVATYSAKEFKLKSPLLKDFYPKQAFWGDTLFLTGRYLKNLIALNSNTVMLGTVPCNYLGIKNDSTICVDVPFDLSTLTSELSLLINGYNLHGNQPFELKAPQFIITPTHGTWSTTVTLRGRFNKSLSRSKVFFNNWQTSILSLTRDSIKVEVPIDFVDPIATVTYKASPFEIISPDNFTFFPPVINSFSPSSALPGSIVTISGNYFGLINHNDITVRFGNLTAEIMNVSVSSLQAVVPVGYTGAVKISVSVNSQTTISANDFTVTRPVITSVSPLTGTFNDLLTISGANLTSDSFSSEVQLVNIDYSGNWGLQIVSSSPNELVVRVSTEIDSIPKTIFLSEGLVETTYPGPFILSPPQINSFSPAVLSTGQNLSITGLNFNPGPTGNQVSWGTYPLTVLSSAPGQIAVQIPAGTPAGINRISVKVGGYIRYSSGTLEIL